MPKSDNYASLKKTYQIFYANLKQAEMKRTKRPW